MSEEKNYRTPQEIQTEYSQVCMRMGDFQVKNHSNQVEVDKLMKRVGELNLEMLESNAYFAKLNAELEAKKNEVA